MNNKKYNIKAILGTIIFHGIILLILLFMGFSTPLPLPQEQGILVAFGNSDLGLGNTQASLIKEITKPKQNTKAKEPKELVQSTNQTEKILTQDNEDAPSINTTKAIKKKKTKKKKKTIKKKKRDLEKEKAIREKNRLKKIEEERIKEEKAIKAKIASINSQAKSIFGRKTGDNSGNSGNTNGNGNMGRPDGSLEGDYKGAGKGNSGVSYSLDGRSATNIIKPSDSFQESGKVVVTIFVNTDGKVTRATAGAPGTTTHNKQLHNLAEKAARQTTFSRNEASTLQRGTITYIFILR